MEHIQLLRLIESDVAFALLCATSGLSDSLMREVEILKQHDLDTRNYLQNLSIDHCGSGRNVFETIKTHKDTIEAIRLEHI